MLSEFGETWLKSSSRIVLQGKDSIELNAHALSEYWQVWEALASDTLESKQWAKLLQEIQKFRYPEEILIQRDINRDYYLFYETSLKEISQTRPAACVCTKLQSQFRKEGVDHSSCLHTASSNSSPPLLFFP